MITFLFWNINSRPITHIVSDITLKNDIDVLMLVESNIPPENLLRNLNKDTMQPQYRFPSGIICESIHVYTRFSKRFTRVVVESNRLTIRSIDLPGLSPILLAVTHLPSKLHWKESSQTIESTLVAADINIAEDKEGHSRTILVGDLNMNPFEPGVVSAGALNSVITRDLAKRDSRTVQKRDYSFFYNPMWGLFGDSTPGPPGTYYYPSSEHTAYFWNIFDQVLVRPALLDKFDTEELSILDRHGANSLLTDHGLPNKNYASDHLPIRFKLDL